MSKIIDLSKVVRPPLAWGNQGENGATQLFLDISEFFAADHNGHAVVVFTRSDGKSYIHNFQIENEKLFITLSQTDTYLVGKCETQISWLSEKNRILKSLNFKSFIAPAASELPLPLTDESIEALDDLRGYVEEAKNLVESAKTTKQIIFCDALPTTGMSEFVYVLSSTNTMYYWANGAWHLLSGSGECDCDDPDFVYGGSASGPGDKNAVWMGGSATTN